MISWLSYLYNKNPHKYDACLYIEMRPWPLFHIITTVLYVDAFIYYIIYDIELRHHGSQSDFLKFKEESSDLFSMEYIHWHREMHIRSYNWQFIYIYSLLKCTKLHCVSMKLAQRWCHNDGYNQYNLILTASMLALVKAVDCYFHNRLSSWEI